MGRRDISKVYDRMKPDDDQKREMYRRIMDMAGTDKISADDNEISVVRYKRRNGALFGGIASAAAIAVCSFAWMTYFNENVRPLDQAVENIPFVTETPETENEKETEKTEEQVNESRFPDRNDTVLTDSDKKFRCEFTGDINKNYTGVYNGNLSWWDGETEYDFYYTDGSDFDEKKSLLNSGGETVNHVYSVQNTRDYLLFFSYTDMPDLVEVNVFDIHSKEHISTCSLGIEDDTRTWTSDSDGGIYRIGDNYIQELDIYGGLAGEYKINFEDYYDNSWRLNDLYFMDSGDIIAMISCNDTVSYILVLDSRFKIKRTMESPLVYGGYTAGKYGNGLVVYDYASQYYADGNKDSVFLFDPENMTLSELNDTGLENCRFMRGGGVYDFFTEKDGYVYGYTDGTSELIAESINDNDIPEGMLSENNMFVFQFGDSVCLGCQKSRNKMVIYSEHPDGTVSETELYNRGFYKYAFENAEMTDDGHYKILLPTGENAYTVYDTDISSGALSETVINSDAPFLTASFFTDNYTGVLDYSNDNPVPDLVIYDKNGEVYNTPGSIFYVKNFVLPHDDILVYNQYGENGEESEKWTMLDLNTHETRTLKNSLPYDEQGKCFSGSGKYDYFFISEDDGIYGGVIDGDEFRYCRLMSFDNLEFSDGEEISGPNIVSFFYDSDDHFYVWTNIGLAEITAVS